MLLLMLLMFVVVAVVVVVVAFRFCALFQATFSPPRLTLPSPAQLPAAVIKSEIVDAK